MLGGGVVSHKYSLLRQRTEGAAVVDSMMEDELEFLKEDREEKEGEKGL